MDKILVTIFGGGIIVFITWFFFGKKEQKVEASGNIKIKVSGGYNPNNIVVKAGQETTLKFLRTDPNSCLEELIFPELKIKKYLPLNTPVAVKIAPKILGEYSFHCAMNMYSGKVIAS